MPIDPLGYSEYSKFFLVPSHVCGAVFGQELFDILCEDTLILVICALQGQSSRLPIIDRVVLCEALHSHVAQRAIGFAGPLLKRDIDYVVDPVGAG